MSPRIPAQTRKVVYNMHQYFNEKKRKPNTWEYREDLNINKYVAKMVGFSARSVRKIVLNASKSLNEYGCKDVILPREDEEEGDCVENPDDPDDPDDDATIIIKEEIDDEIIKEEVDIEEQLARKRRQEEEMPSSSKKMRTDFPAENIPPQDPDTVGKESGKKETELLPEFFMTKMLNTQQEIIGILKNQVLLQDPDPALLTFLRFVGAKLQRLDELQRIELQDKITEMVIEY